MTPKEKAKELVDKYYDMKWQSYSHKKTSIKSMTKLSSKQCALIAVDEIISIKLLWYQKDTKELDYWQEVKQEIEKL